MAFEYTSRDRVRGFLPSSVTLSETSEPSDLTADSWITGFEAVADMALIEGGQASPATDATLKAVLDIVVAQRVAWQILFVRGVAKKDDPFLTQFDDLMKALKEGGTVVATDGRPLVWSYTMDAETNGDASMQPAFTRDKRY